MSDFDPDAFVAASFDATPQPATEPQQFDPDEFVQAFTTPEQERRQQLDANMAARDDIAKKLEYVKSRPGGAEAEVDGVKVGEIDDWMRGAEFAEMDPDAVNQIMGAVDSLYAGKVKERGFGRIMRDAVAGRSVDQTSRMLIRSLYAIKKADAGDLEFLRALESDEQDNQLQNPKAVGSVRDIRDVGDAFLFAAESLGENSVNMAAITVAGLATGGAATALGASAATAGGVGMAATGAASLALSTGEAIGDQSREGRVDRGWALAQGAGYAALDMVGGAEMRTVRGLMRGAPKEVLKMTRGQLLNTATKGGLEVLKRGLGEGLTEAAQSQLVGRAVRYGQTGKALAPGETPGEAGWASVDEFAGGFFGAAGPGMASMPVEVYRAKKMVGASDRILSEMAADPDFNKLDAYDRVMMANNLIGRAQEPAYQHVVDDAAAPEDRRQMAQQALDRIAEMRKASEIAMKPNAKAVLDKYGDAFSDGSFDSVPVEVQSMFDAKKAQLSGRAEYDGNAMTGNTIYHDNDSGVSLIESREGDIAVINDQGLKMPVGENNRFLVEEDFDGDRAATLKAAVSFANQLSRFNQWRIQSNTAKYEAIKRMAEQAHPGIEVIAYDSVAALPENIQEEVRSSNARDGFFSGGRIYIELDAIKSPAHAAITLSHEGFHKAFAEYAKATGLKASEYTEERLARAWEGRQANPDAWTRVEAGLRGFFRDKFGVTGMSEADTEILLGKIGAMKPTTGGSQTYAQDIPLGEDQSRWAQTKPPAAEAGAASQSSPIVETRQVAPRTENAQTRRAALEGGMLAPSGQTTDVAEQTTATKPDVAPAAETAQPQAEAGDARQQVADMESAERLKARYPKEYQEALDAVDGDAENALGLLREQIGNRERVQREAKQRQDIVAKMDAKQVLTPLDVRILAAEDILGPDLYRLGYRRVKATGEWRHVDDQPPFTPTLVTTAPQLDAMDTQAADEPGVNPEATTMPAGAPVADPVAVTPPVAETPATAAAVALDASPAEVAPPVGDNSTPTATTVDKETLTPDASVDTESQQQDALRKAKTFADKLKAKYPPVDVQTSEILVQVDGFKQFKEDADPKTGVVEDQRLMGQPYSLAENPIVVMEMKDGRKVIVTGRHRLDLYRRNNIETIPAHIIKESDGWTPADAATLDAFLNILDEKGSIHDYVKFFDAIKPTAAEAAEDGLTAREKGRTAILISQSAAPDIRSAVNYDAKYRRRRADGQNADITAAQAAAIAEAAPMGAAVENEAIQREVLRDAFKGLTPLELKNRVQVYKRQIAISGMPQSSEMDLFGGTGNGLREEADKVADAISAKQADLMSIRATLNNAINHGDALQLTKEQARVLGIRNVKDMGQLQRALDKIKTELAYWSVEILDDARMEQARTAAGVPVAGNKQSISQPDAGVLPAETSSPVEGNPPAEAKPAIREVKTGRVGKTRIVPAEPVDVQTPKEKPPLVGGKWEVDTPIFDADYKGERFTYGLKYRPMQIGAQPKGFIIGSVKPSENFTYGTVDYPRQLTDDEVKAYELVPVDRPPATREVKTGRRGETKTVTAETKPVPAAPSATPTVDPEEGLTVRRVVLGKVGEMGNKRYGGAVVSSARLGLYLATDQNTPKNLLTIAASDDPKVWAKNGLRKFDTFEQAWQHAQVETKPFQSAAVAAAIPVAAEPDIVRAFRAAMKSETDTQGERADVRRAISETAWSLMGPRNIGRRRVAIEALTGKRPPQGKAGVEQLKQALTAWHEASMGDVKPVPTGKGRAVAPAVIPNSRSLKVTNLDAMPKGTGARYLETVKGEGDVLVAKAWRRKLPDTASTTAVFVDMVPAKPLFPVNKTAKLVKKIDRWVKLTLDNYRNEAIETALGIKITFEDGSVIYAPKDGDIFNQVLAYADQFNKEAGLTTWAYSDRFGGTEKDYSIGMITNTGGIMEGRKNEIKLDITAASKPDLSLDAATPADLDAEARQRQAANDRAAMLDRAAAPLEGNAGDTTAVLPGMADYVEPNLFDAADSDIRFRLRTDPAPEKTEKAYKLFRMQDGKLYPLYVKANEPIDIGVWLDAEEGERKGTGVKSRLGRLAYRPGWHAGDLPLATHIGEKANTNDAKPSFRNDEHVWAEVEMAADVDWQDEANKRGTSARDKAITDQIPVNGFYRYKTNPNMTGTWLIGGSMKVNRILSDAEVAEINDAAGVSDLPRRSPLDMTRYGFAADSGLRLRESGVTPEQDAAYMAAVQAGDTETAQRMVDDAARQAGYRVVYHGTNADNITTFKPREGRFGKAVYTATSEERAKGYGKKVMRLFANPDTSIYGPEQDAIVYSGNPSNFKSADAVTMDGDRVVPLSERFNPQSADIRFRESGMFYDDSPVDVSPDSLTPEVLARLSRIAKREGYDSRGANDVREYLVTGRKTKDGTQLPPGIKAGKLTGDWAKFYREATNGASNRKAKLEAKKTGENAHAYVNRARIRQLGYTTDLREAGYILPDGRLIDLSGKREGGDPGTRSYDHREVGETRGMQEFMSEGNIRINGAQGQIDIAAEPTLDQYDVIAKIIRQVGPEQVSVDLSDGLGEYSANNQYYSQNRRRTLEPTDRDNDRTIISKIRAYYNGVDVGIRYRESGVLPGDDRQIRTTQRYIADWMQSNELPAYVTSDPVTNQETLDAAKSELGRHDDAGAVLIAELGRKTRPVTPVERTVLLIEQARLESDVAKERDAVYAARQNGDARDEAYAQSRYEHLLQSAQVMSEVMGEAGSAAGRALQAIKIGILSDMSLAGMMRTAEATKGFKGLSEKEDAWIRALFDDYTRLLQELESGQPDAPGGAAGASQRALKSVQNRRATKTAEDRRERAGALVDALLAEEGGIGDIAGLKSVIDQLADAIVQENPGIAVDDFNTKLHAEVMNLVGDIIQPSVAEVRDVFSGYGKVTPLNQEVVAKKKRDLRALDQLLAKRDDILQGRAPLRTGQTRDEQNQEMRDLNKEIQDLMKRLGIKATDPAKQIKTPLDALKTRLLHRIEDLNASIKSGRKLVTNETPLTYDDEAKSLVERRDGLQRDYDAIFKPAGLTEQQRLEVAIKAAERNLLDWNERLARAQLGDFAQPAKPDAPQSEQLTAIRDQVQRAKDEVARLQSVLAPEIAERRALELWRKAQDRRDAEYTRRLAAQDFAPKPKKVREMSDADFQKWRAVENKKTEFRREMEKWREKNLPPAVRAAHKVFAASDIAKAIRASFDWSAFGRQGWFVTLSHPVKAKQAFADMYAATWSTKDAMALQEEIDNRPTAQLRMQAKVSITSVDGNASFSAMEEQAQALALDSLKRAGYILRGGIEASNRAYATYLNRMRADLFDIMIASHPTGKPSVEELKLIGFYVNAATGRGEITSHPEAARTLSAVLWSPRLQVSRMQMALGVPVIRAAMNGQWWAAKAIGKEYARSLSGMTLAMMAGTMVASLFHSDDDPDEDLVGLDPRSSKFGKVRLMGNTWVDFTGGAVQYIVLGTKMAAGESVDKYGHVVKLRGKEKMFGRSVLGEVGRSFRGKTHPVVGLALDAIEGETMIGDEVTPWYIVKNLVTPLSIQNTVETMIEEGVPAGVAIGVADSLGFAANGYEMDGFKVCEKNYLDARKALLDADSQQDKEAVFARAPFLRYSSRLEALRSRSAKLLRKAKQLEKEGKDFAEIQESAEEYRRQFNDLIVNARAD